MRTAVGCKHPRAEHALAFAQHVRSFYRGRAKKSEIECATSYDEPNATESQVQTVHQAPTVYVGLRLFKVLLCCTFIMWEITCLFRITIPDFTM